MSDRNAPPLTFLNTQKARFLPLKTEEARHAGLRFILLMQLFYYLLLRAFLSAKARSRITLARSGFTS